MVAAAGSIPAFPTCPYFRAGSALERECYPRGATAVYGSFRSCCILRFLTATQQRGVVVGHTSPIQVRHVGSLETNLKFHADPETTEVKMDLARAEKIPIRRERVDGVLN
jgi:hypothetical protein